MTTYLYHNKDAYVCFFHNAYYELFFLTALLTLVPWSYCRLHSIKVQPYKIALTSHAGCQLYFWPDNLKLGVPTTSPTGLWGGLTELKKALYYKVVYYKGHNSGIAKRKRDIGQVLWGGVRCARCFHSSRHITLPASWGVLQLGGSLNSVL